MRVTRTSSATAGGRHLPNFNSIDISSGSSFRDWAGNETNFPRELAEHALAHVIGDKAEQAYRRSDAMTRRRELMDNMGALLRGRGWSERRGAQTPGVTKWARKAAFDPFRSFGNRLGPPSVSCIGLL